MFVLSMLIHQDPSHKKREAEEAYTKLKTEVLLTDFTWKKGHFTEEFNVTWWMAQMQ